jgi:prephenate dehydrogenase
MPVRVGIIGLGLMGGSLALALRAARPDLGVLGSDPDEATMRRTVALGLLDPGDPREADVLVLAAPLAALPEVLAGLTGWPGIVTDVASTKVRIMGLAAAAGIDLVGGHPMAGRERFGIEAADAKLFQGAPWVLTRDEPAVTELVVSVGAVPVFMDAERHDRLVAGVSHAAFGLSAAYVLALAGLPDWADMQRIAGPGYRDVSRLASGDPELYAAIVSTNRQPVADALRAVEASLARLRRHVEAGDARLVELFEEAKSARDRWASADAREGER